MRILCAVSFVAVVALAQPSIAREKPIRFWNLTAETISELYMAPAGTGKFGPNQCLNDKDGTVETDEMLTVKDIMPGTYDLRLKDVSGRTCLVKSVKVKAHDNFSVHEKELTDCTK